jgi:deoxyribodipyrimidine photo-lyase
MNFDQRRVMKLFDRPIIDGPIIYWMSRDQRVQDNFSLEYCKKLAKENNQSFEVIFCLVENFLGAGERQYDFMLKGLEYVSSQFSKQGIKFNLIKGEPIKTVSEYVNHNKCGALITDFDPLRIKRNWQEGVGKNISCPLFIVDSHNIVPVWVASNKQEYGAYTLRPKINKLIDEFLVLPGCDTSRDNESLQVARDFIENKLEQYDLLRNNPDANAQSNLSPYLHFGHIYSGRVALMVKESKASQKAKDAFLEELIIRKELSDNFCYYNKDYDNINGFPDWAKKTLEDHKNDEREYLYTKEQFEKALTHDDIWNRAQKEMVEKGKMPGYLRMYWAKKILEWTKDVSEAMEIAIYLNDKYELDGRDPNGYTGIAWSLGGVHDRAWGERKVFGKIRYMSYKGVKSKIVC